VVARERRQARALETNFNITAIDLKSKRQLSQPTLRQGVQKNAKTFASRGLHFYPPCFFILGRDSGGARLPERDTRYHQRPDIISVGAYFRK